MELEHLLSALIVEAQLSERETVIILSYFNIVGGKKTLKDLARQYSLSIQRVSMIREHALSKMRTALRAKQLDTTELRAAAQEHSYKELIETLIGYPTHLEKKLP